MCELEMDIFRVGRPSMRGLIAHDYIYLRQKKEVALQENKNLFARIRDNRVNIACPQIEELSYELDAVRVN